ncbi:UDP-N-acetylenolpyruvoylglucosamine reductase [Prochlorococcus marinus str. MIT 9321]|uniref:UDP-N-acetylenolpyruvoylglucosamine reductase n=1 Tax=Prochlorococcus marinus str. MIT 9401 TaxID=167551 RepID=A0A0A2B225_PROMR|nr:UDP-N-acetylmuramate dehydrogenase [Prochlorococcus marinus]KGG03309.1 UDP-N-acetylenolpyruvoylglucosamine reductase [Prochlorococcus marinus str. MIT 9321]KGG06091.1 UDP-N-acetylenolpyruvoylglucosamine reductase [Prochlorococcus marinus str. MIT 9322]KGG06664.1 UDP-N-acetylenolpyruvoylglucosamine reductase [Prochlorococcus marinus str. MIT 9401]
MIKKIFSENFNLSSYTTIKVGGVAEYFAEPRNLDEFSYLIKWAHLNKQKCQIIGAGSNLLINNIFIKGLVICTKKLRSLTIEPYSGIVEAEAGVMLPTLSNSLAKNGLQGGEWAVGIPGTLGGAIYMNAGTGKLSLAKNLISVTVINNTTYEKLEIDKKDIKFQYRFSSFQRNDLTIISAKLHFEPNGNMEQLIQTTKNNLKLKTETQPYHQPSFGSVFKNPENNYAAKLIDDIGLKGFKVGGAEVSSMHSNFIINNSSASSKDIYELITVIQQKVLQNKGIFLQPEVRMIGFDYPN